MSRRRNVMPGNFQSTSIPQILDALGFDHQSQQVIRHAAEVQSETLGNFMKHAVTPRLDAVRHSHPASIDKYEDDMTSGMFGRLGFDMEERKHLVMAAAAQGMSTSTYIKRAVEDRVDQMASKGELNGWDSGHEPLWSEPPPKRSWRNGFWGLLKRSVTWDL